MFEGQVGTGYRGDIALDDITYAAGSCQCKCQNKLITLILNSFLICFFCFK